MAPEVSSASDPLIIAARTGRVQVARRLLAAGTHPDIHSAAGWTPLHSASWNDNPEVVLLLIQHQASLEAQYQQPNISPPVRRTALQTAAQRGHVKIAEILLDAGANIEAGAPGFATPLVLAAKGGHTAFAELLLDRGANVNAQYADNCTALHAAAYTGHAAVVDLLVRRGAEIEALFRSRSPLHKAAERGHVEAAKVLLNHNASINARSDFGWTPLHIAAKEGYPAMVILLLDRGAEVNCRSPSGWSPLNLAADNGHGDIVRLLLHNGASRETMIDRLGLTALHQAAAGGYTDIVVLLLNHGADIEARSRDDSTPLHLAASSGHIAVVATLLERNANAKAKTKAGKTPHDLANDKQHHQVSSLLPAPPAISDLRFAAINLNMENQHDGASFLAAGKSGAGAWLSRLDGYNRLIQAATASGKGAVPPVRIAVLDTGCDSNARYFGMYPDQLDRIQGDHWHDFAGSEPTPVDEDTNKHGTMVSLLLMRVARNAEIFVARIARTGSELQASADNVARAIHHAQDPTKWNVDIVCMSFGFRQESPPIREAIGRAFLDRNSSIVFFAAAANNGANERELFPAYLHPVISVRGTDNQGAFVNAYDPPPVPMNEGLPLYGTLGENVPYTSTETSSGCSVATPIMAGMVAMVMQWVACNAASKRAQEKLRTPAGVLELLKSSAVNKGNNRYYAHIWDLFENEGRNCVQLVEAAMLRLP